MKRITDRYYIIAGLDRLVPDRCYVLERTGACSKARSLVSSLETRRRFDRRLSGQIARDIADTSVDDVLIGHEVSVRAHQEAGAGRGRRAWRARSARGLAGAGAAAAAGFCQPDGRTARNLRRSRRRIASSWRHNWQARATTARSDQG